MKKTDRAGPCTESDTEGLWEYGGIEPTAANGCIDPISRKVDALVDVEVDGVRYSIRARSLPSDLEP